MDLRFASDFGEIPSALFANEPIRIAMLALIAAQPVAGKVTMGANRLEAFRNILQELTAGDVNLQGARLRVELNLPRASSIYAADNRVFANGWSERLVRTQFSRFYNQAVLEYLLSEGASECFVAHSTLELASSQCSQVLAGRAHPVQNLLSLLRVSYGQGIFSSTPKIPDHPHCTHVVSPMQPSA